LVVTPNIGGAIVPAQTEVEGVDKGALDMAMVYHAYSVKFFPAAGLFAAKVGGLTPTQMIYWLRAGGGDELAREMYDKLNVVFVATSVVGPPEVWAHTKNPLNSLADLKGLKMRTAGEGGDVLAKMGVTPVLIPGAEIYDAMKRGVVDAIEAGGFELNWALAFQEVSKYAYISPSRAPYAGDGLWVSKSSWAKLTPDLQMVVKAATESETPYYIAKALIGEAASLEKYKAYGIQIKTLPKDIEDELAKQADIYYAGKGATDPFYAKVLDSMAKFKKLAEEQGVR
jgi:TRAP-type mannitol/chloroaromatic compound transport system substrate-binding protein